MAPVSVLLDSHVLIWLIARDSRIGPEAQALIDDAEKVYVSAATIWELAIKADTGRLKLPETFEADVLRSGFIELPISFDHTRSIKGISLLQNDPFDRLLVAQASAENLRFLTADKAILSAKLGFVSDVTK